MDPGNPASLEVAGFGSIDEETGGGQSDRKRRKTIPNPMDTHFQFLQEQTAQTMAYQGARADRTSTGGMMMMMGRPPPQGNPSAGVGWGTRQHQTQNLGNLQQPSSLQDHGASLSGRVDANNLVSENMLASNEERGGAASRPSPNNLLGEDRGGPMNGRQDAQHQQMMAFQAQQLVQQAQQLLQQAAFMTRAQGFNFQSGLFPHQSNPGSHIMNMPTFFNFVSPANAAINPDAFTADDASQRDDMMPLDLGAGRGPFTDFEPLLFPEDDAKSHSDNDNDTVLTGRGPVILAMECDTANISEYQCFVRRQVEIFEAGYKDIEVNPKGRNKPIVLGQVGIRCCHCSNIPTKERKKGAVYFPAKLHGLYQAARNLASEHLCTHCEHIPAEIREQLFVLKEKKSSAGGGKDYWGDAVRILGIFEDADGLRFKKEKK